MLNKNSTLETTKSHLGSVKRPNPDWVSQVEQQPQSLTAFIPSNLNLDKLLKENPPSFKYHKDNFIYLIDTIYSQYGRQEKNIFEYHMNLHSAILQRRVREYRKHLDYLIENSILVEDKQYIVGKKSRGVAFTNQYCTELKQTQITSTKLIRKMLSFYNVEQNSYLPSIDDSEINYLLKWLVDGKLRIDFKAAKTYLKALYLKDRDTFTETKTYKRVSKKPDFDFQRSQEYMATQKYNSRLRPLILFHRGNFCARIDKTAGRLHTVLTQLKSDLRQFITYDGQPLVAIDIVNSQPYLASVLLNSVKFRQNNLINTIQLYNPKYSTTPSFPIMLAKLIQSVENKEDTLNYLQAVKGGQFYESFGEQLEIDVKTNENRDLVKTATFSSIFSPNQLAPHIEGIRLFKQVYPSVFKVFSKIKYGKGTHRTLACVLQNFEAQLILHTACKRISQLNSAIPMFTLHDSIITIPKYQFLVRDMMKETLTDAIEMAPELKLEKWERVA